ncbi:hypothetical protein [Bacteroides sp.]
MRLFLLRVIVVKEAMWLHQLKSREERKYYWENESPVFDTSAFCEITQSNLLIDMVITHTAPSFCYPVSKIGIIGSTGISMKHILSTFQTFASLYSISES